MKNKVIKKLTWLFVRPFSCMNLVYDRKLEQVRCKKQCTLCKDLSEYAKKNF